MAKRTLLDMVQGILRSLKLDEVNSIGDTGYSTDVAHVIKDTYFNLLQNRQVPEHHELFTLTALGDSTRPAIMRLPDNIEELDWLKYDKRTSVTDARLRFTAVDYMDPARFIELSNGRDTTDTTLYGTQTDLTSGLTLVYRKNNNPQWWTTFDDEYIVFDGLDTTIDTTLQASKSQAYGKVEPTFTISDAFVPDLDSNLFPLLYNASKAAASIELKKEPNPVAGSTARAQAIASQNNLRRHKDSNAPSTGPNYGRK